MLAVHRDVAADPTEQIEINISIVSLRPLIREAFQQLITRQNLVVVGKEKTFADVGENPGRGRALDLVVGIFESNHETDKALLELKGVRARFARAKVIVLTASISPAVLRAAVEANVEAVLTTEVSPMVLQRAVELVLLGHRLLPAEMAELLDPAPRHVEAEPSTLVLDGAPTRSPDRGRATALSPREHEILLQLVNGCSNKVIARQLNITEATVKVHVKALLRKTQMANRTQAAVWALNTQLQGTATEPFPRTSQGRLGNSRQGESLIDILPTRVGVVVPIKCDD
jgi:two-component system nitrate/nitrite response regulator NarL